VLLVFAGSWQPAVVLLALCVALFTSAHVVLHKRDVRSAAGWVGLVWLVPIFGALLYLLLGINRIRRRAILLRRGTSRYNRSGLHDASIPNPSVVELTAGESHLANLSTAIGTVTGRRLLTGNRIRPLSSGDVAYPAMLDAIAAAQSSISLATYIFDTERVGMRFIEALAAAQRRGVQVRVLIDAVGARYSMPRPDRVLRKQGVRCALFMPGFPIWRAPYFNLRNHRKILVVDGTLGFTGGINIRGGHVLADNPAHPVRDLHFELAGPVVAQLQEIFAEDWEFTTGEPLDDESWFPEIAPVGSMLARGIADGPDENFERFTWALLAALACARSSALIVSPYFLPDTALNAALSAAALRGVNVDVLLPEQGNLSVVQWAMWRQLEDVLGHGVRVWLTPPPFDHTKLMLVDEEWALIGSANWDTRSLRLNFEFGVECYDRQLARALTAQVSSRMAAARPLSLEELMARPYPARVRDGFARLLMPYL
jgi:cardiolipin synthase